MKKRYWISGIIVVLIIVSAASHGGNSGSAAPTSGKVSDSGSGSGSTSGSGASATKSTEHKIGDTFTVGEYQVTVSKLSTASTVGDPNGLNSKAKGEYYIVDMTIKNLDKTASTVDSNLFKIKDSSGNEYTADSTATMEQDSSANFFLQQLNPGVQESGKLVFDMPANLKGLTLELSGGFTSSDSTTLKLN